MVLYKIWRELAFVCYIENFAITRYVIMRVECTYIIILYFKNKFKDQVKNSIFLIEIYLTDNENVSLLFSIQILGTTICPVCKYSNNNKAIIEMEQQVTHCSEIIGLCLIKLFSEMLKIFYYFGIKLCVFSFWAMDALVYGNRQNSYFGFLNYSKNKTKLEIFYQA